MILKPSPSDWTRACVGIYGLSIAELEQIVVAVKVYHERTGLWPLAEHVRIELQRPGL